jgi:hypothetical protein
MSGDPGSTSGAGFEITAPIIDYGPVDPNAPSQTITTPDGQTNWNPNWYQETQDYYADPNPANDIRILPHYTTPTPSSGPSYSAPAASPSLPPPPPPPPPTPPDPWIRTSNFVEVKGVKQAEPDTILFNDDAISPELLIELQFEDLAGMELINISRSDMIDGQDVVYSPIKLLSRVRQKFNPNNIIAMPESSNSFFARYAIDLILRGLYRPYFDENGDLVIEIDDVKDSELIEVEIDAAGTINEVEFL